jgi:hypothetical protein
MTAESALPPPLFSIIAVHTGVLLFASQFAAKRWPISGSRLRLFLLELLLWGLLFIGTITYYSATSHVNFYTTLGIPTTAPSGSIKRAYKRASLQYHPDRLPADATTEQQSSAAAHFADLGDMTDILLSPAERKAYDWFGPLSDAQHEAAHLAKYGAHLLPQTEQAVAIHSGAAYLLHAVWTLLLIQSNSRYGGMRTLMSAITILICIAGTEGLLHSSMRSYLTEFVCDMLGLPTHAKNDSVPQFNYTLFEWRSWLHLIYPSILYLLCILSECTSSQSTIANDETLQLQTIQALVAGQHACLVTQNRSLEQIERRSRGLPPLPPNVITNSTTSQLAPLTSPFGDSESGLTQTQRMQRQQVAQAVAHRRYIDAEKAKNGRLGIPSWMWSIGLFLFFNYLSRS